MTRSGYLDSPTFREREIRNLVTRCERRVIDQRTEVESLRTSLVEAQRRLGNLESDLAQAQALADELGVTLQGRDMGLGTVAAVLQSQPLVEEVTG